MALVISLRRGECFFVDETPVRVTRVVSFREFILQVNDGQRYTVTDDRMVEILPDVFVGVGHSKQPYLACLAVEAPREIAIVREKLYEPMEG